MGLLLAVVALALFGVGVTLALSGGSPAVVLTGLGLAALAVAVVWRGLR